MSFFGNGIPMWDSTEGLALAREMEEKLSKKCHCHFALGGSVMYKGSSNKDLDLIVYPHDDSDANNMAYIAKELTKLGFITAVHASGPYGESHRAIVTSLNGRRVDFIFVGY